MLERFTDELWSIVQDYSVGYTKLAYDVPLDQLCKLVSLDFGVRLGLHLVSEIINRDEQEFSLPGSWR